MMARDNKTVGMSIMFLERKTKGRSRKQSFGKGNAVLILS